MDNRSSESRMDRSLCLSPFEMVKIAVFYYYFLNYYVQSEICGFLNDINREFLMRTLLKWGYHTQSQLRNCPEPILCINLWSGELQAIVLQPIKELRDFEFSLVIDWQLRETKETNHTEVIIKGCKNYSLDAKMIWICWRKSGIQIDLNWDFYTDLVV